MAGFEAGFENFEFLEGVGGAGVVVAEDADVFGDVRFGMGLEVAEDESAASG